jgi:hypothetical protein
LLAAGGLAVVVLICSRSLFNGPDPTWSSGPPVTPSPVTASPSRAGLPSPTVKPSPTSSARRATRPARKPTPRTRTSQAAPTVLVGPANEWELWFMLQRYCSDVHRAREARMRSGPSPAEGNWECRGRTTSVLIDMTAACRHTYGSAVFARYTDRNNAMSWRCYRRA